MSQKRALFDSDELTRRTFLGGLAGGLLGVTALPGLASARQLITSDAVRPATAKNVIFLYMLGGMSHIDTFDLKPGTAVQGPIEPVATSADGVRISKRFRKLRHEMDKVCVINSMNSTQGSHLHGRYYLHTGYRKRGTIQHPSMGAWLSLLGEKLSSTLPSHVEIGGGLHTASGGFLGASHAPLPIAAPLAGLQDSVRADNVSEDVLARRLARVREMNREFKEKYPSKAVSAQIEAYEGALRLMKSSDLKAFDISREPESLRDAYGRTEFGQGVLLARRLVEHGVRYVEVVCSGWDTHSDNFGEMKAIVPTLDNALATLLADLKSRGLLDETLVVVATEFGRTPTIVPERQGRDHHPAAFCSLLAGGGIRGGRSYGKTDETGHNVIEDLVTIPDLNATIAYALGLPLDRKVHSPSGRPFTIAGKGRPITGLFA